MTHDAVAYGRRGSDDRPPMKRAPVTDVYVWTSFSCNNSSDYRLVAEFDSPRAAEAMRTELAKFFTSHAKEHDKQSGTEEFDWPGEPTSVARAFGKKHGHAWKEFLIWGEGQLAGDEPEVGVVGKNLVLYHGYSSGGFGPDVPRVLQEAGARLVEKGAQDGPPVLYGSFEVSKDGKLEKELTTFFEQHNGNATRLTDWSWPKWATSDGAGKVEDVSFVIEDGRCTFTLPLRADNIGSFQKYLAAAKKLELRLASKSDIAQNKKREEKRAQAATSAGVQPKAFLEQTSKAKATKRGAMKVTPLFEWDDKINGADEIVCAGDEIIAFAGDTGKTQRLVVRGGKARTVTNLAFPKAWLQGFCVEADGTWRAGGEKGRIYVSTDAGKTWKEEKHPGLAAALGPANRVWSVCRFQGALWAAGEGGVARQADGKWTRVVVPAAMKAKEPGFYAQTYLPRLVVVEDTLFVLAFGIARWDGKKLVAELDCQHDVQTLAASANGTLLAAGRLKLTGKSAKILASRTVWRRPREGKWSMLAEKAIDVGKLTASEIKQGIGYSETFKAVLCVDGLVILIGENEMPDRQMNAVRISEDDGKTFRRMAVPSKTRITVTAAIADGRDGVLVAGQGGVLLRVSRDGIGTWATGAKSASAKVAAAKAPAAKGAARRFELVGGGSSKFWEITLAGDSLTTRFGRIGTDGQTSTKSFGSAESCKKEHDKLVAEKTKKGYRAK